MMGRARRVIGVILLCTGIGMAVYQSYQDTLVLPNTPEEAKSQDSSVQPSDQPLARTVLDTIPVKGRAPKTGYTREQFGDGWGRVGECDMRNIILHRDLKNVVVSGDCKIVSGSLDDPYTGQTILFQRGEQTSDDVQIDHIVALSNAWQTGAQLLTLTQRIALANDPLELVAVDGATNQAKSDADAATWLPPYKPFRCQYVARQIAVKSKYQLWVTQAENDAMRRVLSGCPTQQLPAPLVSADSN